MTELPGIAQLLKKVDQEEIDEHWKSIETTTESVVCCEKDAKGKLAAALKEMDDFNVAEYDDIDEMLANFNEVFDACTSCFGKEIEVDYVKIQRFINSCPGLIKHEYVDYISPKYDGKRTDEMTMKWEDFDDIVHIV